MRRGHANGLCADCDRKVAPGIQLCGECQIEAKKISYGWKHLVESEARIRQLVRRDYGATSSPVGSTLGDQLKHMTAVSKRAANAAYQFTGAKNAA